MARKPDPKSLGEPDLELEPAPRSARTVQEQQLGARPAGEHVDGRPAHVQLFRERVSRQ
jgi:hypothetical protein